MAIRTLEGLETRARKQLEELIHLQRDNVTPLNEIARQLNVGAIRFTPILGSAGLLSTSQKTFDVVLDSHAEHRTGEILSGESSDWNALSPGLRFSIAHELAHVMVVGIAGGDPNDGLLFKHERAIDTLCNELSGKLLLPKERLVRELSGRLFDVANYYRLFGEFRVSAEVMARRLAESDIKLAFEQENGMVALVRANANHMCFVAGQLWGAAASAIFGLGPAQSEHSFLKDSKFPAGQPVDELKLPVPLEATLMNNESGEKECAATWGGGRSTKLLPCALQFKRVAEEPIAAFLTIKVAPAPLEPEQLPSFSS